MLSLTCMKAFLLWKIKDDILKVSCVKTTLEPIDWNLLIFFFLKNTFFKISSLCPTEERYRFEYMRVRREYWFFVVVVVELCL